MSTENLDRYRNTKTLNYELTTNNTNGKIGKINTLYSTTQH